MMNAVPADQRGAASGIRATFTNSGFVLSIGIFFTLMIIGIASSLPSTLFHGLTHEGVPAASAHRVAGLPPVGTLFAAFLGYNPMRTLLGSHVLGHVGAAHAAVITGKRFFPSLISAPFHRGLVIAFGASALLCAAAAVASVWAGDTHHAALEPDGGAERETAGIGRAVPLDGGDVTGREAVWDDGARLGLADPESRRPARVSEGTP
jgi:hypothetical protein